MEKNNEEIKEVYLKYVKPSMKNRSVRSQADSVFRFEKAKEQAGMDIVDKDIIIQYVNEFLDSLDMHKVSDPKVKVKDREKRRIEYSEVENIDKIEDRDDIVWIKFTKDGYIGVIGTSRDIFFDIPESEDEYTDEKHTTSGIILHHLGKKWDEDEVLIFPLFKIPSGLNRSDIESGIGNYLIEKKVPILDFYSHDY